MHLSGEGDADARRVLADFDSSPGARNAALRDLFIDRGGFDAWALRYAERLARQDETDAERALRMNGADPKYVLRNHPAVAEIQAAADQIEVACSS